MVKLASTNFERIPVFDRARREKSAAQIILVLGGGPIGIEMAGELK